MVGKAGFAGKCVRVDNKSNKGLESGFFKDFWLFGQSKLLGCRLRSQSKGIKLRFFLGFYHAGVFYNVSFSFSLMFPTTTDSRFRYPRASTQG
jgi:hypothetical protein